MSADAIYQDNSFEMQFAVTKRATATGKPGAVVTGLVDLRGMILAAEDDTSAIHTDLDVPLTERSGTPGTYFAIITKTAINLRLFPAYAGESVFVCARNADTEIVVKTKCVAVRKG